MASQTGSIDLTASNSVKLAAEAGWQSDLDGYYTKSEIDVTVGGINSTVSTKVGEDEVISSINQSSESVSINASKISLTGAVTISDLASDANNALADAAKTATNYISADTNGIRIASSSPSTATTYQHQTATETEFIVDSESRLLVSGDGIRVGKPYVSVDTDNESHMEIDYHSLQLVDRDGNTYFFVSDLRDRDGYVTDEFVCDGETTEFALSVSCRPITAVATIDGVQATNVEYGASYVKLADAPSSGSILSVRYEPMPAFSQELKAYTLGTRKEHQRIGTYSTVEGTDNTASGECSHAEGVGTTASARSSHSEGYQTEAIGSDSHAEGNSTDATGMVSHAEGFVTKASGTYSHAEGDYSEARGESSHAEGYYTQAFGNNSHAQNYRTIASSENQTVVGRCNVGDANDTYAVIVGNGADQYTRSNALTVDWDGNVNLSGRIVAQQRIQSRNSLGGVSLEMADSGNKGVWDTTDGVWIICRNSNDNIVINGDNFSVDASGLVNAGRKVVAAGNEMVALAASATSGSTNRGLWDETGGAWIIYRSTDGSIVLGNSAADHLYARASTVTTNTTNVTQSGDNHCWNNGAVCSFVYRCAVKSALANGSELAVGTLPANYRPPYDMAVDVYTSTAVCVTAKAGTNGTITVRNVSGSSLATSVLLRISGTFAL